MAPNRPSGKVDLEELIEWIKRRPELSDIRETAEKAKADYQPGNPTPRERIILSVDRKYKPKNGSFLRPIKDIVWVPPTNMRGKAYSTPTLDNTINATSKMMSISTLWDFFCTLPLLKFGLSGPLGVFSWPAAITLSLILLVASNVAGEKSTDRHDQGHSKTATLGLIAFILLSLAKTAFSGVGVDLFIGSRAVASRYADQLVEEKLLSDQNELDRQRQAQPLLLAARKECTDLENRLQGGIDRSKNEKAWVSAYILAYGSNVDKVANQSLTTSQVVQKYGSIAKVPGACNRKRLLEAISAEKTKDFSKEIDNKKRLSASIPALAFLQKHEPELFSEHFKNKNGSIEWVSGTTAVAQATDQFWQQLGKGEFGKLGFSLFFLIISLILTSVASIMIYQLSKNESVKASYSQEVMDDRGPKLQSYIEAVEARREEH